VAEKKDEDIPPDEEERIRQEIRQESEVEAKLEMKYPGPAPTTKEEWLKYFDEFAEKILILQNEIPEDYKISGLTWLLYQLIGQITITMGYSQRGFYDGYMKWTVEFKKGEF